MQPYIHRKPEKQTVGLFISDFYTFNYLLKGLGNGQKWLTSDTTRADRCTSPTDAVGIAGDASGFDGCDQEHATESIIFYVASGRLGYQSVLYEGSGERSILLCCTALVLL